MIRKNHFGYEIFECSNCETQVNEIDEYCQICGRQFNSFQENFDNEKEKIPKFIKKQKNENNFIFDEDAIKLDLEPRYKKLLINQIKLLRIESYFNYIIRLIFQEDYLKKNLQIEKVTLLSLYYETANKILKDNASIILDSSINSYEEIYTSFNWEEHHLYYGKQLGLIVNTVLDIINHDKEIKQIIGLNENENPYNSQKARQFVQNLIVIGYSQATQRIEDEINNENYFGIEIIKNKNDEELIIYLTPKGMLEAPQFFSKIEKENRIDEFNKMLNKIGIQRIENNELKKQYETSTILVFNNKMYYHYKQFNLSYNDFFNKRINRPHFNSILLETQANYKKA